MKEKKLTMNDIAKMAGVGKSTVSRYFNEGYVKEETRLKIKKIIDDYGYEPNALAKIMKAKKSNLIGIVVPTLDSKTSARMVMSLDEYLRHQKYTPIIINTNHNELRELNSIEQLWRMNVDGIILLATTLTMAHQNIASKLDIPFVVLAQKLEHGISIINDDYHAGYEIGEYVAKKGHQKIAFLGVSNKDKAVGVIRKKGVSDGLNDHGIEHFDFIESDFSFEKASRKINQYLKKNMPTIIICATDNLALACYKEIQELGLKMPDDISLISFGGYEVSSLITPTLTTIRFENEEAGCIAGQTIINLINEKSVPPLQSVGYTLIEGKSVRNI